jgi:SAM-dependent methyltransferase
MSSAQTPLFNGIAGLYQRYAEITDETYRPYVERALPASGARAVDLGCGTGRFTGLLADRCDHVLAVDIADRQLDIARAQHSRPNVEYRLGSLLDVSADTDGPFDLVFSVNTLFHLFAKHDPDRVLRHVRSLVAPGGCAVVVDIISAGPQFMLYLRWTGLRDAARTLVRRRSLPDAWSVLRLRQHPVWMQHARANQPLTRPDFHHSYSTVFPGAQFTDDISPIVCAIHWHNTASPEAGPPQTEPSG